MIRTTTIRACTVQNPIRGPGGRHFIVIVDMRIYLGIYCRYYNCYESNLNALNRESTSELAEITWESFRGYSMGMTEAEMALKAL